MGSMFTCNLLISSASLLPLSTLSILNIGNEKTSNINKIKNEYLILCVLSVTMPIINGPTIEEPLSVILKRLKNVDSLPFGMMMVNRDLETAATLPIEIPYHTPKINISN